MLFLWVFIYSEELLRELINCIPLNETTYELEEKRPLDTWFVCQSSNPLSSVHDSNLVLTTFSTFLLLLLETPSLSAVASRCLVSSLQADQDTVNILKAIPQIPAGFKGSVYVDESYWCALLQLSISTHDYLVRQRCLHVICAAFSGAPQRFNVSPFVYCRKEENRSLLRQAVQRFIDVPSLITLLATHWPFSPQEFSLVELLELHNSMPLVIDMMIENNCDFSLLFDHCTHHPDHVTLWNEILQAFLLIWDSLSLEVVGCLIGHFDSTISDNGYFLEMLERLLTQNETQSMLLVLSALPFCSQEQKQVVFRNAIHPRNCWRFLISLFLANFRI